MSTSSFADAFACVLAATRRARGLSQEDLAALAQFDRTYPSLLERGLRDLKMVSFLRLCAALEQSPPVMLAETLALMQREAVAAISRPQGRLTAEPRLTRERGPSRRRRVG
jgi:transcriptional regulator with XRE-family HTH domain